MGVVCRARPVTYFRCSLARPAQEIYRSNQIEENAKRMRMEIVPDRGLPLKVPASLSRCRTRCSSSPLICPSPGPAAITAGRQCGKHGTYGSRCLGRARSQQDSGRMERRRACGKITAPACNRPARRESRQAVTAAHRTIVTGHRHWQIHPSPTQKACLSYWRDCKLSKASK